MTRVLHLVTWLETGGLELWLANLTVSLSKFGIHSDICCRGAHVGSRAHEFVDLGAKVMHAPQGKGGPFSQRHRRRVREILQAGAYDAVHSHCGDLSFPFLEEAREAGVASRVLLYHSVEPHRIEGLPAAYGNLVRGLRPVWGPYCRLRSLRSATAAVGCSSAVVKRIGLDPQAVLHLGIDLGRFRARVEDRRSSVLRVVTVGSLNEAKNYPTVIEVAVRVNSLGIPVEFLIAGEGPLRRDLEELINARRLKNVRLVGDVRNIPELLSTCDLALHPSVIEGLSIAVLEYQAAGLPVMASNIDQNLEALAPPLRRLALPPHDISGFANAIATIWSESSQRRKLGLEGRAWVESEFSIEVCARRLSRLYAKEGVAEICAES